MELSTYKELNEIKWKMAKMAKKSSDGNKSSLILDKNN